MNALQIKTPKACDCDYCDVCENCECSGDKHCVRCRNENNTFKNFYYEIQELGGQLLTGQDTGNSTIEQQLGLLRRMCIFTQQNPTFLQNHVPEYDALYGTITYLLKQTAAAPLYDLFRATLKFLDGL